MKTIKTLALAAAILSGLAIAVPSPAAACPKGDRETFVTPDENAGGTWVDRCVCVGPAGWACDEGYFTPWQGAA